MQRQCVKQEILARDSIACWIKLAPLALFCVTLSVSRNMVADFWLTVLYNLLGIMLLHDPIFFFLAKLQLSNRWPHM